MKKTLVILLTMSFILVGCSNSLNEVEEAANETEEAIKADVETIFEDVNTSINEMEVSVDETFINEGETAIVTTDAFMAMNEEAYEEVYDLLEAEEYNTEIDQLILEDKVMIIGEGVEVEVLDTDLTEAKVQISNTGEVGFIHRSLLTQL